MGTVDTAHREWANRPADQRFWGLHDPRFLATALAHKERAEEREIVADRLATLIDATGVDASDNVILREKGRPDLPFTSYSFGQLCERTGRKGGRGYLPQLDASRAVENLREDMRTASERGKWDVDVSGLARDAAGREARDMLRSGSGAVQVLSDDRQVRAVTGRKYARLWNADLIARLEEGLGGHWKTPPAYPVWGAEDHPDARPATKADLLDDSGFGSTVAVGDIIAPGGAYVSDRDMFLLLANVSRGVEGPNGRALMRAAIIRNSEVGDGSLWIQCFLLDFVCGNHFLWGATKVVDVRAAHTSRMNLDKGLRNGIAALREYSEAGSDADAAGMRKLATMSIGNSLDGARAGLSKAIRMCDEAAPFAGLSRKLLRDGTAIAARRAGEVVEGYAEVVEDGRYGTNPWSAWSLLSGMTEASQRLPHASERVRADRSVGALASLLLSE